MRISQFAMLVCLALTIVATGVTKPVKAEEVKIAVVNVQELMSESLAAKDIQKQVQEQKKKFQDEFGAVEKELHEKQKSLGEEHSSLSQEEFAKKRDAFEEEFISARTRVQKSKRDMDEAVTKSMANLRTHIWKIVATIAEEDGYQLILARQNVVLVSKEIDITTEVMKRLNASVKNVKVEMSGGK